MIIYEISNPSDAYTVAAPNLETAAVAVLLLGEGRYGLVDVDGKTVMPVMLFGLGNETWLEEKFGADFNAVFRSVGYTAIADCLDTVLLGDMAERAVYEEALRALKLVSPSNIVPFKVGWDKAHRPTSTNDIGAHAKRLATGFRELAAKLIGGDGVKNDAG